MVHAALNGDWVRARKMHYSLYALSKGMFIETNPIPVKTALKLMGKITGDLRLPLVPMIKEKERSLRELLKVKEVIE